MDGYERLSRMESELLWDRERERPEEELDQLFDRPIEAEEPEQDPCDLYDRCRECPNFEDCFSFSVSQVSRKVA